MIPAIGDALAAGGAWALGVALLAGLVAGLNPCCLALYPAVAVTCCAEADCEGPRQRLGLRAGAYVLGTAVTTTVAGILAAAAGHAVLTLGRAPRYALALVPIVMGLHLLRWLRIPLPSWSAAKAGGGLATAFGAGLLMALVLGSCGTPVLAGILSYAAYTGSLAFGGLLLFVYGIGNGLPLLVLGTGTGALAQRLGRGKTAAVNATVSGVLLIGLGLYLLASA